MRHTSPLVALALLSGTAFADSAQKPTVTKQAKPYKPAAPATIEISAGAYQDNHSLIIGAENPDGVTQYAGVPNKGVAVDVAFYPLTVKHANGWYSSAGLSLDIAQSVGGTVTFDDAESVSDYTINSRRLNAGAHYKLTAGRLSIDSQLGFGQLRYAVQDAPQTFEVPNTSTNYLSAGTHVDLDVFRGATVGVGAKYLHALGGNGDMTSMDWYGPGRSSGTAVDATLSIPLPQGMFLRGKLALTEITTSFDGIGVITEEEGVANARQSTTTASLTFGIKR